MHEAVARRWRTTTSLYPGEPVVASPFNVSEVFTSADSLLLAVKQNNPDANMGDIRRSCMNSASVHSGRVMLIGDGADSFFGPGTAKLGEELFTLILRKGESTMASAIATLQTSTALDSTHRFRVDDDEALSAAMSALIAHWKLGGFASVVTTEELFLEPSVDIFFAAVDQAYALLGDRFNAQDFPGLATALAMPRNILFHTARHKDMTCSTSTPSKTTCKLLVAAGIGHVRAGAALEEKMAVVEAVKRARSWYTFSMGATPLFKIAVPYGCALLADDRLLGMWPDEVKVFGKVYMVLFDHRGERAELGMRECWHVKMVVERTLTQQKIAQSVGKYGLPFAVLDE